MLKSVGYEKWKQTHPGKSYVSPCDNWKIKMVSKGAYKGYAIRKGAELHRRDGDGWELMDYYDSTDEAKAAAGYPKVKLSPSGLVLGPA